jgi:TRAP-type C4-dicarboxylate transport system substrate-binding protein
MKRIFLYCFLSLVIMGGIAAESGAQTAQPLVWKLQSFTVPGSSMWQGFLVPFADLVKQKSQGKFEIALQAPGTIVPPPEITKAVGQGVIPAGLTSPGYDGGIIPESYVLTGLPFSFVDAPQQVDFWYDYKGGAAFKAAADAYNAKGVQPIALTILRDPMVIMTQFPVSAVSDFQGKKIRATGAHAEAIKALGARQVTLGLGDVYNALQTRVIDGHFMAISGLESYKWKEITKYVVEPAWMYCSPSLLEVNLNEWNKLPADFRKIFQDSAREVVAKTLLSFSEKKYTEYVDAATKAGVKWITLSPAEAAKYRAATLPLWQYAEKISPKTGEIVQLLKAYLKEKGVSFPGN